MWCCLISVVLDSTSNAESLQGCTQQGSGNFMVQRIEPTMSTCWTHFLCLAARLLFLFKRARVGSFPEALNILFLWIRSPSGDFGPAAYGQWRDMSLLEIVHFILKRSWSFAVIQDQGHSPLPFLSLSLVSPFDNAQLCIFAGST